MIFRHRINLFINYHYYVNIVSNKHFHLSHVNHVRKPSLARRVSNSTFEDVQEHTVSSVFHDPSKNVNVYKNFYGVEGDEGVINVDELGGSEKSVQGLKKTTLQQPMDEFRSFNFGAIRLDNENKPSYIASRRSVKLNRNDLKELNNWEGNMEQSKDLGTIKNEINDRPYLRKKQTMPNILLTKDIDEPNSLSSVEKNFYSYDRLQQNASLNENIQQNATLSDKIQQTGSSSGISSLPETNNINKDASYFQSKDSNVTEPYKQNQFANHDHSPTVSASFIDKYYFMENCASEDFIEEQKFEKRNIKVSDRKSETNVHKLKKDTANSFNSDNSPSENQHQFDSPNISESFIDKEYFAENYAKNSVLQRENYSDNFVEGQYFKESNLNVSESDYDTVSASQNKDNYPPEKLTDNFVPIYKESKPDAVSEKSQIENKFYNHVNNITFNHNMNVQVLTKEIDELTSSKLNTVTFKKSKPQNKDVQKKYDNVSTIKTDLTNASKKDSQVLSQTKNSKEEVNSEKAVNSYEKSQNKEFLAENKIETAFDFVKKLKRKELSDDIKKGISAKKEKKVDSKGFRILKHQVPSLEYFTRDEMLELLKESVIYTDEEIVVLNKPYNLVIHESSTSQDLACLSRYLDDLAKLLDQNTNSPKLITVHRLDKETTGCLLLARNEVSAARLKSLFAQRKIVKTYWIVTTQVPDPMEGIIDMPISEGKIEKRSRMVLHPNLPAEIPYVSHSKSGKQAITQYSVIAVSGNAALVEVRPETGIKHQIRVHFGFGLGCPILGDHKYSYLDKLVPQKLPSDLLQKLQVRQSKVRHIPLHIHSKHLFIPQYSNEGNLFITAPLSKHMSENLRFLKFKKK